MEHLLSQKIDDNFYYIGVNDRITHKFEGMWPIPNGVAYNSYLVKGKANILIDSVKLNRITVFLERLYDALEGEDLDYIIIDHIEPDHSSGLTTIMDNYPNTKIVCNKRTLPFLKNYYNIEDNIIVVKDKETITLGDKRYTFYTTPMVHWPESMVCYDEDDKILFSQDIFGGFGTLDGAIFDDQIDFDSQYLDETRRYYINIVGKYSKQALAALNKLSHLDIKMICPDHGPIWRKDPSKILNLYTSLAKQETVDGVLIVYGSMYGNTEQMAELVAQGVVEGGIGVVKVSDITKVDMSYILSDTWKYKGVILGSCSYDNNIFPPMGYLLSDLSHQKMKNNIWGAFGSFSWSGGAVKRLKGFLEEEKLNYIETIPEIQGAANPKEAEELKELGREVARRILKASEEK
ncbi:FprA family A-type flavoprotein [Peptoniphilus catoniae]|uniref:FprA family A-type flavoprotein n=1 Tax=Peptoniphilus catoniae TaxID=1660341 RepID=UPI0010FEA4CE|nr:FprA family A-type flavoprotein [Peptoniphilus catoniae]